MHEIDYKCPACQYTYKREYGSFNGDGEVIEGDEPPVKIVPRHAQLVIPANEYWENDHQVMLLGCPKCKSVTFED